MLNNRVPWDAAIKFTAILIQSPSVVLKTIVLRLFPISTFCKRTPSFPGFHVALNDLIDVYHVKVVPIPSLDGTIVLYFLLGRRMS